MGKKSNTSQAATGSAAHAPARHNMEFTRNMHGAVVTLRVLDQEHSYLGTGLHATLTMRKGGRVAFFDPSRTLGKTSVADIEAWFDTAKVCPCTECAEPAFDPAVHITNRGGLCERCFAGEHRVNLTNALHAEEAAFSRMDIAKKQEGYSHRIKGRVHHHQGSDRQVVFYVQSVDDAVIRQHLKWLGSDVLDDYRAVAL